MKKIKLAQILRAYVEEMKKHNNEIHRLFNATQPVDSLMTQWHRLHIVSEIRKYRLRIGN